MQNNSMDIAESIFGEDTGNHNGLDFNVVATFGDTTLFDNETMKRGENVEVRSSFGELTVEFYSNNAIGLYRGIPPQVVNGKTISRGQLGLTKMDDLMKKVYTAAQNDDPYADQLIYNLHQASLSLDDIISKFDKYISDEIAKKLTPGIAMKISKPENCPRFEVYLKTDLGKHIFWQITSIDKLVVKNLYCRTRSIIPRATSVKINATLSSALWNMYHSVYFWKHTGVTRQDVEQNNQVAQNAFAQMNDKLPLSENILNKTKRSPLAPAILSKPEQQAQQKTEESATDLV